MLWSVKEAVEKKRERQGRRPASTTDLSDTAGKESSSPWGDFELQGWLESLNLVEPIESAVCHPLKEYFEAEEGVKNLGADPADGADAATGQQECKMDFLVSIGAHSSHEPLARMLHDQKLVDRLALMIWDGARKLRGGSGNGGAVDLEGHGGLVTKFFEDGDGRALQFGKLTTFYQGLDGFLGPPNPNLREAMEDEHTRQADSKLEFRVPNYKTQTTPRIEFWFVAEPTDARLAALGRTKEGWPKEPDLQTTPQPSLPTAGHEIATDRRAARQALEPRHFEGQLADRNARLREIGMEKILDDELIAARLYTGPMYTKYNAVLRDIGQLRLRADGTSSRTISEKEIGDELCNLVKDRRQNEKSSDMDKQASDTCGNLYTTTLHVINSSVIKLGKLHRAQPVYRGIARRTLQKHLMRKDEQTNTRGGIEFGFMSCSKIRHEAERYSYEGASGDPNATPILWEVSTGMIDRGADLSWLSQYPHEEEVLFPALTGLEFISHRVDTHGHSARLLVTVRPSVNHNSLTIEKVLSKMKASHLQLLDLLTDNLRFAGIPKLSLQPLINFKVHAKARDPTWFNSTKNYKWSTIEAIKKQSEVFRSLASRGSAAEHVSLPYDRMKTAAMLAARVGETELAVDLLLRRTKQRYVGEPTAVALGRIAKELLDEGCKQPWPETLANVLSQDVGGGGSGKDDCIPRDKVVELLRARLKHEQPFRLGTHVSVCMDNKSSSPWLNARIRDERQIEVTYKRDKDQQGKERVDPATGAPMYELDRDGKKIKQTSGVEYFVEQDGGGLPFWVPEARVVAPTEHGVPAVLHVAASSGDVELVKMLLEANVNLYATDANLNTALVRAVHAAKQFAMGTASSSYPAGHRTLELEQRQRHRSLKRGKTMALLQASHAMHHTMNSMDDEDVSALEERYTKQCHVVELLCHRRDTPWDFRGVRNLKRQNAFDVAVNNRASRIVRTILDNPAQRILDEGLVEQTIEAWKASTISAKDAAHNKYGRGDASALMLACRAPALDGILLDAVGACGLATELLDAGADVHYCDPTHRLTALHVAAEEGCAPLVELLLRRNAAVHADGREFDENRMRGVDRWDADGKTPLLMAVCSGQPDVAKILLDASADLFFERKGRTLLSNACQYGHDAVARLLLERAAHREEAEGKEPGSLMLNHKNVDHNTKDTPQLCINIAARYGHIGTIRLLLEHGIDLAWELTNDRYTTSLHRACGAGHTHSARLLLLWADKARAGRYARKLVDWQDRRGLTALHYAANGGHSEATLLLLEEYGCDPSLKNDEGKTALWSAAASGQTEVVSILCHNPNAGLEVEARGRSPLAIATAHGHTEVVRALLHARARPEPAGGSVEDDPLMIAVSHANLAIVQMLTETRSSRNNKRGATSMSQLSREEERLQRAARKAHGIYEQKLKAGDTPAAEAYQRVEEHLTSKRNLKRKSSKSLKGAMSKDFRGLQLADAGVSEAAEQTGLKDNKTIVEILNGLTWTKEGASFPGQLVPPRPNAFELRSLQTPLGAFLLHDGVVLQKGPFGSKWLRAGCVPHGVSWSTMWSALKRYVEALLADADSKRQGSRGAIYVAVSMISMQSVDFEWLDKHGFRFHHHRAPGHGATPMRAHSPSALAEMGAQGRDGNGLVVGGGGSNRHAHGGAPEIVYYRWPEACGHDMVPEYATSIEGVTAVMLSPDMTKVLLVWERGSWATAGGAVNPGECKMAALAREIREEVNVEVDETWDGVCYLGGWQAGRARDNLVNDNFSGFVVRLKSEDFQPDMGEIREARWFSIAQLLGAWRRAGRPADSKRFEVDLGLPKGTEANKFKDERNIVQTMMLGWLDTWEQGRGLPVAVKTEQQGEHVGMKAIINDVAKLSARSQASGS